MVENPFMVFPVGVRLLVNLKDGSTYSGTVVASGTTYLLLTMYPELDICSVIYTGDILRTTRLDWK